MAKNKGRGIDHIWKFVKYEGDVSIYALCGCGFHYSCCKPKIENRPFPIVPNPDALYPYCPICGSRKTRYIDDIRKLNKYSWE